MLNQNLAQKIIFPDEIHFELYQKNQKVKSIGSLMQPNSYKNTYSNSQKFQQLPQITHDQMGKEQFSQNSQKNNQPIKSQSKHEISYRADIDGLRTIAVGIVVIFHAWPLFMPGGFIGVDIFFVISGYLISGIIIKQTKKNKFSYIDFYSRRIIRIYPALILVFIFVLVLGAKKLMRRHLEIMTQTMAASTVFAANIEILTAEHDYFDPDTKTNPLLHLWSLGVQEQFYIFWPLLLTVIFKKFQNKAFHILSAYTVVSFVFSIVCVFINPKFDFYFPFCRFWQMSVGGLIAYLNLKIQNKMINNALSLVSVISILTTVWIIDENSLFPGFWALIPTLGAACIIQAGSQAFVNNHILSSKPFVFVGKISYSLYLWHWPLLVFSRILYPEGSKSIYAKPQVMVLIAIVLSILSYYLVENPFRVRKERIVPTVLFLIIICIGISALYIRAHSADFQQHRLNEMARQKQQQYINDMTPLQSDFYVKDGRKIPNSSKNPNRSPPTVDKLKISYQLYIWQLWKRRQITLLGKKVNEGSRYYKPEAKKAIEFYEVANEGSQKQLLIIGDSHARYITSRFQKLFQDSVASGNSSSFPTVIAAIRQASTFISNDTIYNFSISFIKQFKPQRVFIVCRWLFKWRLREQIIHVQQSESKKVFAEMMAIFESELKQLAATGVEIYLAAINPEGHEFDPKKMIGGNEVIQDNTRPVRLSEFRNTYRYYIQLLQSVAMNVSAKIVDFSDYMCYNDICEVLTPNGYSLNSDENHQTKLYVQNWAGSVDFLTEF